MVVVNLLFNLDRISTTTCSRGKSLLRYADIVNFAGMYPKFSLRSTLDINANNLESNTIT